MFTRGTWIAGTITGGLPQIKDTNLYQTGKMTKGEYAASTSKNVGGAFGLMAGIEYGATLGSALIPGVGTIVGTILGGILGDRLGHTIGFEIGNTLFNRQRTLALEEAPERLKLM